MSTSRKDLWCRATAQLCGKRDFGEGFPQSKVLPPIMGQQLMEANGSSSGLMRPVTEMNCIQDAWILIKKKNVNPPKCFIL
jgi:hypothetical protein